MFELSIVLVYGHSMMTTENIILHPFNLFLTMIVSIKSLPQPKHNEDKNTQSGDEAWPRFGSSFRKLIHNLLFCSIQNRLSTIVARRLNYNKMLKYFFYSPLGTPCGENTWNIWTLLLLLFITLFFWMAAGQEASSLVHPQT